MKKIVVEGCKTTNGSEFKKIGESRGKSLLEVHNVEMGAKSGMQTDVVKMSDAAPYCLLKFIIQDGWEDFASVHSIELL